MVKHLEEFLKKHKEGPKTIFKQLDNDKLAHIQKALSALPFSSASDVVNSVNRLPNVRRALTFEADASSFLSSLWNLTLGTIIIKHYHTWAEGLPGNLWGETGCMEKIWD